VTPVQATADLTGKVIKIVDGDTIDVLTDDKETIRMITDNLDVDKTRTKQANQADVPA